MQWVVLGWNTGAVNLYDRLGAQNLTKTEDWHVMTLRKEKFAEFAKEDEETSSKYGILICK